MDLRQCLENTCHNIIYSQKDASYFDSLDVVIWETHHSLDRKREQKQEIQNSMHGYNGPGFPKQYYIVHYDFMTFSKIYYCS